MSNESKTRKIGGAIKNGEDAWLLGRAIKSLLRCDEAEVVQGIARYVISKYSSLRVGSEFIERRRRTVFPPVAAFLGAAMRFLEVRVGGGSDGAAWVARLDNERGALRELPRLLPELKWTELEFHRKPDRAALLALPRKLFPLRRRIFKLTRALLRGGHKFFMVLRVAELIGYYARYLDIFTKGNFSLAFVSSHSNPHGIAFQAAARRCGIPVVLITHGMPVRPVAKLFYDLAVVHCEAARQTYLEEGCCLKRVIIHGRRQNYAPMPAGDLPDKLAVGIFLCKDVNEKRLRLLTENLLTHPRAASILIRPHPKNLFLEFDDWLASLNDPRVKRSLNDSVFNDLREIDVVFAGNSSVLIEAVTAGRPGIYVPGLDYGSPDMHRFVVHGLIYPFGENRSIDFEAALRFYQRAEWLLVLGLFANIDEDESSIQTRVSKAIRELYPDTHN